MQYESFIRLVRTLTEHGVRFVMIGVGAANLYARTGAEVFSTKDRDLFLPLDARNLLQAWQLSVEAGCDLWTGDEPLGRLSICRSPKRSAARASSSTRGSCSFARS